MKRMKPIAAKVRVPRPGMHAVSARLRRPPRVSGLRVPPVYLKNRSVAYSQNKYATKTDGDLVDFAKRQGQDLGRRIVRHGVASIPSMLANPKKGLQKAALGVITSKIGDEATRAIYKPLKKVHEKVEGVESKVRSKVGKLSTAKKVGLGIAAAPLLPAYLAYRATKVGTRPENLVSNLGATLVGGPTGLIGNVAQQVVSDYIENPGL